MLSWGQLSCLLLRCCPVTSPAALCFWRHSTCLLCCVSYRIQSHKTWRRIKCLMSCCCRSTELLCIFCLNLCAWQFALVTVVQKHTNGLCISAVTQQFLLLLYCTKRRPWYIITKLSSQRCEYTSTHFRNLCPAGHGGAVSAATPAVEQTREEAKRAKQAEKKARRKTRQALDQEVSAAAAPQAPTLPGAELSVQSLLIPATAVEAETTAAVAGLTQGSAAIDCGTPLTPASWYLATAWAQRHVLLCRVQASGESALAQNVLIRVSCANVLCTSAYA